LDYSLKLAHAITVKLHPFFSFLADAGAIDDSAGMLELVI
jgi:hypothetical protein